MAPLQCSREAPPCALRPPAARAAPQPPLPCPPPAWWHPAPGPSLGGAGGGRGRPHPPSGRGRERTATAAGVGGAGRTPAGLRKPGPQKRSRHGWVSVLLPSLPPPPPKKICVGGESYLLVSFGPSLLDLGLKTSASVLL